MKRLEFRHFPTNSIIIFYQMRLEILPKSYQMLSFFIAAISKCMGSNLAPTALSADLLEEIGGFCISPENEQWHLCWSVLPFAYGTFDASEPEANPHEFQKVDILRTGNSVCHKCLITRSPDRLRACLKSRSQACHPA